MPQQPVPRDSNPRAASCFIAEAGSTRHECQSGSSASLPWSPRSRKMRTQSRPDNRTSANAESPAEPLDQQFEYRHSDHYPGPQPATASNTTSRPGRRASVSRVAPRAVRIVTSRRSRVHAPIASAQYSRTQSVAPRPPTHHSRRMGRILPTISSCRGRLESLCLVFGISRAQLSGKRGHLGIQLAGVVPGLILPIARWLWRFDSEPRGRPDFIHTCVFQGRRTRPATRPQWSVPCPRYAVPAQRPPPRCQNVPRKCITDHRSVPAACAVSVPVRNSRPATGSTPMTCPNCGLATRHSCRACVAVPAILKSVVVRYRFQRWTPRARSLKSSPPIFASDRFSSRKRVLSE